MVMVWGCLQLVELFKNFKPFLVTKRQCGLLETPRRTEKIEIEKIESYRSNGHNWFSYQNRKSPVPVLFFSWVWSLDINKVTVKFRHWTAWLQHKFAHPNINLIATSGNQARLCSRDRRILRAWDLDALQRPIQPLYHSTKSSRRKHHQ